MAYTETQLQALRDALASGATRVTYDGQTIEYRSVAELQRAIAVVERGLGRRAGGVQYPTFSRDGL